MDAPVEKWLIVGKDAGDGGARRDGRNRRAGKDKKYDKSHLRLSAKRPENAARHSMGPGVARGATFHAQQHHADGRTAELPAPFIPLGNAP